MSSTATIIIDKCRWSPVVAAGRQWSPVVASGRRWSPVVASWSPVVTVNHCRSLSVSRRQPLLAIVSRHQP